MKLRKAKHIKRRSIPVKGVPTAAKLMGNVRRARNRASRKRDG